jgi:hypothetical protein
MRSEQQEINDQRFVEAVTNTIYNFMSTVDDYRPQMLDLAIRLLMEIEIKGTGRVRDEGRVWREAIDVIEARAKTDAERKYLLLLVFEKVMNAVRSGVHHDITREELFREREQQSKP